MEILDYITIAVFAAGIMFVGSLFSSTGKNMKSFFAGGGNVSWWISGLSLFMGFFSAGTFVVWGSIAYSMGFVAVTIQLTMAAAGFAVGLLIAPRWNKTGCLTAAEYITRRYGASTQKLYTYIFLFISIFTTGSFLYPIAKIIEVAAGIPLSSSILILGVFCMIYVSLGGLRAVVVTDVLQFIILFAAVIIVIPLAFGEVGGVPEFLARVPEGFFTLFAGEYNWVFIVAFMLYNLFFLGGNWAYVQRYTSVRTPRDAKKVGVLFGVLYTFSPILWMLPPMIYRVFEPGLSGLENENAYLLMCKQTMPAGMLGLMLGGMIFATASSLNATLNISAGVFTNDIFKRLRPAAGETTLMKVARISTLGFGVLAIAVALLIPNMGGIVNVVISGGGTILNSKTEEWYPSTTSWGYSKNGMAVVAESGAESWQTSNTLTYAISRGKHYFNAVLGFELRGYTATRLSTRAEGFENQSFNGAFDIGQGSVFPENVQTNRERNTSESEFLRLNYTLAEKYIFTASIRRDGSSKFGKNNKYGYFPSAAFAWSIGKEEFMKQQKIFSDMKLRLSYGVTGNDRIPAYQSLSRTDKTYYSGDNNSVQLGLSPSEISNPDLKWETTYQLNGGLDISMFRNRLSIEADVYYKKTKDMLLHADVPSQIGSYRQWQNIGQVDNKGFELTINTVNIQKRNFTWSTSLNFNLNRNKVVSLGDVSSIPVKVAGGHITEVGRVMVGHPIGSGWGYVFDGIYQQSDFDERGNLKEGVPSFAGITVKPGDMKFKDIAGNDNVIDPNNDKTVIANSDPKHFGGMTNSFTFKNFDLSFMFQWSYGNDIINIGRYRYEGFVGYNNVSTDYWRNRWTEERPGNRYPSLNGEGKTEMSSYYVEDGSYLRLKNLTVGYTLPAHITRKIGLSHLRIYVTAENLFTCTGYSGYDPEVSFWNRLIPGLDYTNYPRARSVFFGVSIKY